MDIPHEKTDRGMRIKVRVQPRASRKEIAGAEGDVLRVRLTAPPAEGEANKQLIEIMAKELKVAKGRVRIVSGEKSRNKVIEVED